MEFAGLAGLLMVVLTGAWIFVCIYRGEKELRNNPGRNRKLHIPVIGLAAIALLFVMLVKFDMLQLPIGAMPAASAAVIVLLYWNYSVYGVRTLLRMIVMTILLSTGYILILLPRLSELK